MTRSWKWQSTALAVFWMLTPNTAAAQLMSTCAPDSPERRGEIGCSIIESKPLPEGLTAPVFCAQPWVRQASPSTLVARRG